MRTIPAELCAPVTGPRGRILCARGATWQGGSWARWPLWRLSPSESPSTRRRLSSRTSARTRSGTTTFRWHIYTTDHFEIYYYPETEQHLERVASYAESAYQQISADLKHDLAFKVPLIVFKTSSEFQEQNVVPGAAQEGVGAFAEPYRDRMVLPIDEPPDLLYRLIVHELTHIFEFDIIPQGLIRRSVPLWVNEGLSDYMTGCWRPIDLMTIRDAAVADIVPKMTDLEGYGGFNNPRLIYNLGHAVFEFIESKWGKEGLRQYLFSLRKSVIGGGEDAYEEAFHLKPEEFDQQFEKYLKDRFKPFRDKERPADYGRNLVPNPQRTKYSTVLSVEPSPSGELIAAMTGNRKEQELDHRAAVCQGRHGRAEPDAGLRPELRLHLHRHARRPLEHRVVDVVVAERATPSRTSSAPRRSARSSSRTR